MKTSILASLLIVSSGLLAAPVLQNPQASGLQLSSIGPMNFAPNGVLLVAEPGSAAIVAIQTPEPADRPFRSLQAPIADTVALVSKALQCGAADVEIVDLTIHPDTGSAYLAVRNRANKQASILQIDADGKAHPLDLPSLPYQRVTLPPSPTGAALRNISGLAYSGDRILATGQSSEEFSSKIFSIPLPLSNDSPSQIFSAETFHVAHKRWETKAPITSFIPHVINGKTYVIGAFACTPIAKFPIENLASGQNIRGTSVVELGSGNRPIDLFSYERDGEQWFITHTQRFKENLFGPSKFWGVRIKASYLDAEDPQLVNENAARRDVKERAGPEGIEIVEALFGAVQVAKVNDQQMAVLREAGDQLRLELCDLP
jgi:hypothetical protein